jgi:hypothetical protein
MSRTSAYVLAAAGLLLAFPAASADDGGTADLSRIDRTIAKEPTYKAEKPRYCLLVFGPEAKFRAWLVQDGDVLYVDRNGNGDLTEDGERIEKAQSDAGNRRWDVGDLTDGELKHTIRQVAEMAVTEASVGDAREFARIKGKHDAAVNTWIMVRAERATSDDRPLPRHIDYIVNGDGTGYLAFADRPGDAPVVHLNGPWTFGLQDIKQHLVAGRKSNLQLGVGTPGSGAGTFAFVLYPDTIPADAYPVGEFTFPPREPGGKAITRTMTFKERC